MRWRRAFGEALSELEETRKKLESIEDPRIGLSALRGEIARSRVEIQQCVRDGVTGIREETGELRRGQDRGAGELGDALSEIRDVLTRLETLRATAPPEENGPEAGAEPDEPGTGEPGTDAPRADQPPADEPGADPQEEHQEEHMENTEPGPRPGADLKSAIEAAYRGEESPARDASAAPPEDPQVAHGVLLLKAAGVASAELIAHRDTWEWLITLAVRHGHFRVPPAVEAIHGGQVRTVLSGRSLIALLIELWNVRTTEPVGAEWALATTAYHRVAADLGRSVVRGGTIRIVLDDGLPPDADG
ncbi:hypothetical protein [Streptomyces sp. LaPpAH-108]|uniref:hypothetical protein n=1 Tax=Streptomyces sp. LaPpAH-108 TaxID=1155714 RepID=UPI00036EC5DD|nr:hypothetical protein [Streptomyces sp. LaPpAH-108]